MRGVFTRALAVFASGLLAAGCIDTGTPDVEVQLRVAGETAAQEPFVASDGWEVTLEEGQLAFGPLTLCAGEQSGSLCETARAEWVDSTVVSLLEGEPKQAGTLRGTSGVVRSWMFDLGFVSLLTAQEPVMLSAAEQLDGQSLRLRLSVRRGAITRVVVVAMPIRAEENAEQGLPIIRSKEATNIERSLKGADTTLTVRFDPRQWLQGVDFAALFSEHPCPKQAETDAGSPTLSDAGDPIEEPTAACSAAVFVEPSSQAYRAIRGALTGGPSPRFEWSRD